MEYQCKTCGRASELVHDCDPDAIEFEVLYRAVAGDAVNRFTEVQWLVFRNALKMDGIARAEQFLVDWGLKEKKVAWITKWVPGDHYYAQGVKFDRYVDAERHLKGLGFSVLGLKEVVVPRTENE